MSIRLVVLVGEECTLPIAYRFVLVLPTMPVAVVVPILKGC
jgi:hypothetical protein